MAQTVDQHHTVGSVTVLGAVSACCKTSYFDFNSGLFVLWGSDSIIHSEFCFYLFALHVSGRIVHCILKQFVTLSYKNGFIVGLKGLMTKAPFN